MAKIGVIIDDMYEDSEYTEPVAAFKNEGHEVVHIGLEKGKKLKGKRNRSSIEIDKEIKDVSVDDFDALLIPGGFSPDKLRAHDAPVQFVREFVDSGKPVFSICHGPQLLITAEVLKGRIITGWKSIAVDIKNAGADYVDQEVVVDGNIISSRSPKDIPAFIKESLKQFSK